MIYDRRTTEVVHQVEGEINLPIDANWTEVLLWADSFWARVLSILDDEKGESDDALARYEYVLARRQDAARGRRVVTPD